MKQYVIGVDFGTLSMRGVLMDALTGRELGQIEKVYPHAVLDRALPDGTPLLPDFALQVPADYRLALGGLKELMASAGVEPGQVKGFCADFTSSTLLALDDKGRPLCEDPVFCREPHAYAKLWKHHGAVDQAQRMQTLARQEKWLEQFGGRVPCEWALPKILETLEQAPRVYENTRWFMEGGDYISLLLTGQVSRAACFAGFKSQWQRDGYAWESFLSALHPGLQDLPRVGWSGPVYPAGACVGKVSLEGSALSGLAVGTPVFTPMIDAHASAPALGAVNEGDMMLVIGTSGVNVYQSGDARPLPGILGNVMDSLVPGLATYEAGQASVGDTFQWFVDTLAGADCHQKARELGISVHQLLTQRAAELAPGESGVVSLDWFNGNRNVLADYRLSGAFVGMTLSTKPHHLYRSLLEGAAFGCRRIVEQFEAHGLAVKSLCAAGGIPQKNPLLMQIYADVLNRSIRVPVCSAPAARGCCVVAAAAIGAHSDLSSAARALAIKEQQLYVPQPAFVKAYDRLYAFYRKLHDHFGVDHPEFMAGLRQLGEK